MFRPTSHPTRHSSPRGAAVRRGRLVRAGQSVVEFAILLPVLLALVGVTIDFARLYQGWTNLESATRDAAQYLATSDLDPLANDYTDPSGTLAANAKNDAKAKTVLDSAIGSAFTPSGASTLGDCGSTPKLTTIVSAPDTAPLHGGSTAYPLQKVEVLSCMPFRTLFAYPFVTTNGYWTLQSDRTYTIIVGR